ncbi:Excalibur calcium-binding domain-containing protein [Streptomyces sp. cf386]|uniref:excalibur calcium-binding domain-containing protein n=1 Tax=Streptomyces sp. cf386 TaxID=1761904 RepID=UPI0008883BE2|nr:excalibur calcium-binding domain-containing protein [Streptomyces sp. cf386]SDO90365.1 Excalibur calcium-binding domain-containing protein [Streptomyces sp. cf386]
MPNPDTAPHVPQQPPPFRPAPRWARKRYLLPALGLAFFLGFAASGSDQGSKNSEAQPTAASPGPTVTVTATMTAPAEEPEPAPTVTATKTVKVTATVTVEPAADSGSDSGGGDSSGSDVFYDNCDAARAAGAAPVYAGDPGYGRHLDRDGDGVACE